MSISSSSSAALSTQDMLAKLEQATEEAASDWLDKQHLIDEDTGGPIDELCLGEGL